MPRSEIGDRSPVQVLLDHRRADVGRAADRRRVSELLGDAAAHGGDVLLRLRSPSPTVPRSARPIAASSVPPHVRKSLTVKSSPMCSCTYWLRCRSVRLVERAVLVAEAEEPRPPRSASSSLQRVGQLCVEDRGADPHLVLAAEVERDPAPANVDMALAQRRDPVRAGLLRVALRARPEPAQVDQTQGDRADACAVEMVAVHVLGHRRADRRQLLAEAHELVELRLLLLRAEARPSRGTACAPRGRARPLGASRPRCGEIHTSRQAGGMLSWSIRSSLAGSVMRLDPLRRSSESRGSSSRGGARPPLRATPALLPRVSHGNLDRRGAEHDRRPRGRSDRARSCSRSRCACCSPT